MPTTNDAQEHTTTKKKKKPVDEKTAQALAKVAKLVALANENENEEEARTAALTAVNLMVEYRLAVIPEAEVERLKRVIGAMQERQRDQSSETVKNMGIGFVAGMVLSKGKLF